MGNLRLQQQQQVPPVQDLIVIMDLDPTLMMESVTVQRTRRAVVWIVSMKMLARMLLLHHLPRRHRHPLRRPLLLQPLLQHRALRFHVLHNRIVRLITCVVDAHVMLETRSTETLIAIVTRVNQRPINRVAVEVRTRFRHTLGVQSKVQNLRRNPFAAIRQFPVCPHRSLIFTNTVWICVVSKIAVTLDSVIIPSQRSFRIMVITTHTSESLLVRGVDFNLP